MRALAFLLLVAASLAVTARPTSQELQAGSHAGRALNADARACPGAVSSATRSAVAQLASDVFWGGNRISYSQPARGAGIRGSVCPTWQGNLRRVPPTEDCSSFVAWLYWTAFGAGTDHLGGRSSWGKNGGVAATGHLRARGKVVTTSRWEPNRLQPGDLCFYHGPTTDHVVIHVGGGRVVGLGGSSKFHRNASGNMPQYGEVNWIMGTGPSFWFLECRRYDAFPA